ncbi:hypothetical protein COBT_000925 [Conglomerata obtusa]
MSNSCIKTNKKPVGIKEENFDVFENEFYDGSAYMNYTAFWYYDKYIGRRDYMFNNQFKFIYNNLTDEERNIFTENFYYECYYPYLQTKARKIYAKDFCKNYVFLPLLDDENLQFFEECKRNKSQNYKTTLNLTIKNLNK